MEKLSNIVKEVIKEYVELHELMGTNHYNSRLSDRFAGEIEFPVVMSTPDHGKLNHELVSSYKLTETERLLILDNIKTVESVDMPDDGEYGIKIHEFNLSHNFLRNMNLSVDDRLRIMKSITQGKSNLYLQDPITKSTGDILFMIVEEQNIKTILYVRSYNLNDKYNHFKGIYGMDDIWRIKLDLGKGEK